MATLKKGGGQNVGLNFLYSLNEIELSDLDLCFLVAEGTDIESYLMKNNFNVLYTLPKNPVMRILKEVLIISRLVRRSNIDVIYTYFGFGFFVTSKPQVIGSADSNLYYPEIDFWNHYSGLSRFKKWIVDKYRILGLKISSAVLFENKALELRGRKIFKLRKTKFIKPSVNFNLNSEPLPFDITTKESRHVGLFLCGWQLNKNVMIIPELAKELKLRGVDIQFVLTAPDDNSHSCTRFMSLLREHQVEDMVKVVGSVKKQHLQELYSRSDLVFLLSRLESFSNNIIESWYFKRPVVVADEEWSKAICNDAAVYVDRSSVTDIADKVIALIENKEFKANLIEKGLNELNRYPTIVEKTEEELRYLKDVAKSY